MTRTGTGEVKRYVGPIRLLSTSSDLERVVDADVRQERSSAGVMSQVRWSARLHQNCAAEFPVRVVVEVGMSRGTGVLSSTGNIDGLDGAPLG